MPKISDLTGYGAKGSGESAKITEGTRDTTKQKASQTLKSPVSAETVLRLRELIPHATPSVGKYRKDVQSARDLMGFMGSHLKKNPALALDFRPLGSLLEQVFPVEAAGLSKMGAPSPYVDKALDVGKTLLNAEDKLMGRENQVFQTLLANKLMTGQEQMHDVTTGSTIGKQDPGITAGGKSKPLTEFQKWQQKKYKDKQKKEFGKLLLDIVPMATKIGRTSNIFHKYATWDDDKQQFIAPGTNMSIARIGGNGMMSLMSGPAGAEFYQSALDMEKLKQLMISGKQSTPAELKQIQDIQGTKWNSNPALVVSGFDSTVDEIIAMVEGRKAMYDSEMTVPYLKSLGLTPETLRQMKMANRMKSIPKRKVAPKYDHPTGAGNTDEPALIIPGSNQGQGSSGVKGTFGVSPDQRKAMEDALK